MECDQVRELLEAYALGALDAQEQAQLERHLAHCPDCERLAREYADVISRLPDALAVASSPRVPASLKNRLLQSIESEETDGARAVAPRTRLTKQALLTWARTWRPRVVGAALALVILAILATWTFQLSIALAQERALRAEYANLVSQQELVLDVIDSPKTVRLVLRSTNGSSAYGKIYSRPDMPEVVAMAARLPLPASGQAYHLWVASQDKMQLAGVMAVNEQGFGILVFKADHNGPVYESAELTLQPTGSAEPAGNPVLTWQVGK